MKHPPIARRDTVVDNYHGTPVADPYRWLEDPVSPETMAWVEGQNEVSSAYFASIPARERIQARLTALWNYPKYSVPVKKGETYFYSKNDGLQNQSVIYRQRTLDGESSVVLDPNTLSEDGTAALSTTVASYDGTLLAYGVSLHGSDWQEIHIRRVESGEEFPEVLHWSKFSGIAWKRDNSGFFYNRLPEPGTVPPEDSSNYSRVYWHALGTPQEQDVLVYERPDFKELSFTPFMTDDGRYLVLHVWHGTDPKNRLYYREADSDGPFVCLLDEADASYSLVGNVGSVFYFQTTLDAPRSRILAIDLDAPEREHWREVLPQQDDAMAFALMAHAQLVVVYL